MEIVLGIASFFCNRAVDCAGAFGHAETAGRRVKRLAVIVLLLWVARAIVISLLETAEWITEREGEE